ncbi:LysE family translocator [Salinisphaera japonica]|uniref:Threonine transporter RhtB n=1 Tax=Salinisphaera japonica YTM-1 TaxID=1209778 RepID=A0A423PJ49_9GAMM|nr:LysE family translocator [Salinisphaera japonica]ROO25617.1 threonine transporter RhtB [Salinisphaera japonica YTM-1]
MFHTTDITLLLTIFSISIGMAISPGQDFALISRNALVHSRRAGVSASFGIAAAVWIHVAYCMTGVALLIVNFPSVYEVIRWIGAAYLIYLGIMSIIGASSGPAAEPGGSLSLSDRKAFVSGFWCNLLNPKMTLILLSIFTQVIKPTTSVTVRLLCGLIISLVHLAWFSALAYWLSTPRLLARIQSWKPIVERLLGVLLILVGAKLVLI